MAPRSRSPVTRPTPLAIPGKPAHDRQARLIQYALAILTAIVVLGPILPVIYQALIDRPLHAADQSLTFDNYRAILTAPSFGGVVRNSLIFSFWSTVISQGLGAVLALLIGRTNLPWARVFCPRLPTAVS